MAPDPGRDLTVVDLNNRVRDLFRTVFPYPVWVRGVLSGRLRPSQRGHLYFQLTEPSPTPGRPLASVDCALFAGTRAVVTRDFARLGFVFDPREGMTVRVLGRVDLWPGTGRYQFIVDTFDPYTFGTPGEGHLRALVDALEADGLLRLNQKRPMPGLPLRVGLVTAGGSAAMEDFLTTLRESGFPFEVLLCPAVMQGPRTAEEVSGAMDRLLGVEGIDVIVITRGGGSATDLSWFDSEVLGRRIALAGTPVISAIGHETDFTLPDFVAHTRARTPTHAATLLVNAAAGASAAIDDAARMLGGLVMPRLRAEARDMEGLVRMLGVAVALHVRRAGLGLEQKAGWLGREASGRIGAMSRGLETIARSLRDRPPPCLAAAARTLDSGLAELSRGAVSILERTGRRLEAAGAVAVARDPGRMLELGWSMTMDGKGNLVRSAADLRDGQEILTRLADGLVASVVHGQERGSG